MSQAAACPEATNWRKTIGQHVGTHASRYQLALCAFAIAALWLPRLSKGFWCDEAGTFWMARDGFQAAIAKCANWPGQSVLYGAFASLFCATGAGKEVLLRLPSIVAGLIAVYFVYRLAESMIGAGAGFLAAIPFACAGFTAYRSTEARPYSLALAAFLVSLWTLDEWVRTSERWRLVLYVLSSALIVYLHYLFAFVFLIQAAYLLSRQFAGVRVNWREFVWAAAAIGILCVPLVPSLRLLSREAHTFPIFDPPTLLRLVFGSVPPRAVAGMVAGLSLALLVFGVKKFDLHRPPAGRLLFLLFWMTAGPVAFFLATRVTSQQIFFPRYVYFATPALYLIMGGILYRLRLERARVLACAVIVAAALILVPRRGRIGEDWRAAIEQLERVTASADPVFIRSPLVESNFLDWKAGLRRDSYLFTPLAAYPIPNPVIPLPWDWNEEAKRYVTEQLVGGIGSRRRFALVGVTDKIFEWMPEYAARLGYRSRVFPVDALTVIVFEHPPRGAEPLPGSGHGKPI